MNRPLKPGGQVLVAAPAPASLLSGLEQRGYRYRYFPEMDEAQAGRQIRDCQGLITSTRVRVDASLLDQAPALQWVGRMGSGMELIDLEETARRGIHCFSSPEGNAGAVAEHALGMMISWGRNIVRSHREVQRGRWLREENRGQELGSQTLGIIGMGHTGRALARLMEGFGTRILGYDIDPDLPFPSRVERVSLAELQAKARILSFHVPLDESTYHYLDAAFVERMAHPFLLVNTSRGPVVERQALLWGLEQGKILGACLDVWEQEPLERMDGPSRQALEQLLARPDCLITPHIAGYSHQALERMGEVLLVKLDRWIGEKS